MILQLFVNASCLSVTLKDNTTVRCVQLFSVWSTCPQDIRSIDDVRTVIVLTCRRLIFFVVLRLTTKFQLVTKALLTRGSANFFPGFRDVISNRLYASIMYGLSATVTRLKTEHTEVGAPEGTVVVKIYSCLLYTSDAADE